jgi:hypothetical protein
MDKSSKYMLGVKADPKSSDARETRFYWGGRYVCSVYVKPALGGIFCTCPYSRRALIDDHGEREVRFLQCAHLKLVRRRKSQ